MKVLHLLAPTPSPHYQQQQGILVVLEDAFLFRVKKKDTMGHLVITFSPYQIGKGQKVYKYTVLGTVRGIRQSHALLV